MKYAHKTMFHGVVNSNKTTQTQPNQKQQLKLNQLQEHSHFFPMSCLAMAILGHMRSKLQFGGQGA